MLTFSQRLIERACSIKQLLAYEPAIRPDFTHTGLDTIASIIFCLMWRGVCDRYAISAYLMERGCRHDLETIDFVLDAYTGRHTNYHLWTTVDSVQFKPLLDAIPGFFEDLDDLD